MDPCKWHSCKKKDPWIFFYLQKTKYSRKPAHLGGLEDPWILFCDIVVIKRIHGSSKNTENSNNWNSKWILKDRKIHGSFYVAVMLEKGSMDLPVLTETQLEHKKMKLSWFVPSGKWIPEPDQGDRPISGYLHTYGFVLVYCNPSKAHFSGAPGPESPAPTVSKDTNFFW